MGIGKKRINFLRNAAAIGSAAALAATMASSTVSAGQPHGQTDSNAANPTKNATGERKPNILYIVLDDIGYSDLGCYGSEIKTPNIDKLAEGGLRYTNFNACPLSSPTRASLLTGRENNSVGMGSVADLSLGPDRPNIQGSVIPEAGTIAEILKEKGYGTFGVGKWHMAPIYTVTPAGPFDYWPMSKGFERYYGFMYGETDQYHPQLVDGNELVPVPETKGYTLNDDLLTHAKQYLTDQVSIYPDKPFFLYYAFGTDHSPQQVPEKYIELYKGVYDRGWDSVRAERFRRQKALSIVPQNTVLTPMDPSVKRWDNLSAGEKKLFIRFMQCYAGYLTQADEEVGKLISYLKEIGQYDNTMVVLIGDNGATRSGGPDGTDCFISGSSGRHPTSKDLMPKYALIGGPDMQALYPKGWAQVSNTPFNKYKGSVYAGALRNPLIVSWPGEIKEGGSIRTQYVHVTDITPTVLDVLKLKAPKVLKGVAQMPMYGTSIASTFLNPHAPEVRSTFITYLVPNRAIYQNGWKAVATHENGTSFDQDAWELYKVSEDYSESNDVAAQYPDKVKALQRLFMSEAAKCNILPLKEISVAALNYIKPGSAADRSCFKYYPGVGHISLAAAPPVNTNSFTIIVPIDRPNKNSSGVLAAMGDEIGGYSFYIRENRLVFLYDKFDTISRIVSDIDVPIGRSIVQFDFKRTSMVGGTGSLYINDRKVGEGEVQTAPVVTFEGLDIGRDTLKAVAGAYKELGEFPFTGEFDYVRFDITPFISNSKGRQTEHTSSSVQ